MGTSLSCASQYNSQTDDLIYRDAAADAMHMTADGLLQWRDVLSADLADDEPVLRELASERLRAVDQELSRRERLSRLSQGVANPADVQYQAWNDLARAVNERTDVPELLTICGVVLRPAGQNSRRGQPEYSGACPVCGGTDRLRAWSGPNGRCWCRQCHWNADAIAVAQSYLPGCQSFRDAVKSLAIMAGTAVPK